MTAAVAWDLEQPLRLRIRIHSGPLVAGVIGMHKFVYDVWGDTANTAKRMEKYREPGRNHLSAATGSLLTDRFRLEAHLAGRIVSRGARQLGYHQPGSPLANAQPRGDCTKCRHAVMVWLLPPDPRLSGQ